MLNLASDLNSHSYLAPIILIRKLDVHVMLQAYLGDHGPLPPNNLGMVFGIYSDTQLKTP